VIREGLVPRTRPDPTAREEIFFVKDAAGFHIRDGSSVTVDVFPGANRVKVRRALLGYAWPWC